MEFKYTVNKEQARTVLSWLRERGGILVWPNGDLATMRQNKSFTVPYRDEHGNVNDEPPNWRCQFSVPEHITDVAEVGIYTVEYVTHWRIGLKKGRGLSVVLSDAANKRLTEYLRKHPDCTYSFGTDDRDYPTVIIKRVGEDRPITLLEDSNELVN